MRRDDFDLPYLIMTAVWKYARAYGDALPQTAQRSHFRAIVWTRVANHETRLCKCQGLKWNFCVRANITFTLAAC